MSVFAGPQYKGALRDYRKEKRKEAERRNARTLPEYRRSYRRQQGTERAELPVTAPRRRGDAIQDAVQQEEADGLHPGVTAPPVPPLAVSSEQPLQ